MSFKTDSKRVLTLGRAAVRGVVTKLMSKVMLAYARNNPDLLDTREFESQLYSHVLKGTIVSHLLGVRSVALNRHVKRKRKLSLSFDALLEVLELQLNADVESLEQLYETDVLRIVRNSTEAVERKLRQELNDVLSKHVLRPEALSRFYDAFNSLGLTGIRDHQIEAIFNTQCAISYHAGQWNGYKHSEVDEILWGFKYVSVGDDVVRPDHVAMDETTLPKDDPFWLANWPPNGWNCRCEVIPIFEERKPIQPKEVEIEDEAGKPTTRPAAADPGFSLNTGEVYAPHPDEVKKEIDAVSPYTATTQGAAPDDTPLESTGAAETAPEPSPNQILDTLATPAAEAVRNDSRKPDPLDPEAAKLPAGVVGRIVAPEPRPTAEAVFAEAAKQPTLGPVHLPPDRKEVLQRAFSRLKATREATSYAPAPYSVIAGMQLREPAAAKWVDVPEHLLTDEALDRSLGEVKPGDIVVKIRNRKGDRVLEFVDGRRVFPTGLYNVISRRWLSINGRRTLTITLEPKR